MSTKLTPDHYALMNIFKGLRADNFDVTSLPAYYNCIAWAAGDDSKVWDASPDHYWPPGAPREHTVASVVAAFEQFGYKQCLDGSFEEGIEKVAIYTTPDNEPAHMARQLPDNRWTSKIALLADIWHSDLEILNHQDYGKASVFLARQRPQ